MAKRTHVVFPTATATSPNGKRTISYGVYLDLDDLQSLAFKASFNKSRKGKDGPVHVEIHAVSVKE